MIRRGPFLCQLGNGAIRGGPRAVPREAAASIALKCVKDEEHSPFLSTAGIDRSRRAMELHSRPAYKTNLFGVLRFVEDRSQANVWRHEIRTGDTVVT